jgi:hypothetical protein
LYRRTIELGRERLGFDRLGLLLIEEETNMMLGTFGTDEKGQIRDERFFRQAQENPDITGILTEQKRIGFWEDTSLKDAGEVVGRGWNAMTVLWNGNKGIGWLATDNLIRREPPTAVQLEILTLYGAALGQLVSRKKVEEERERLIELAGILSPLAIFGPMMLVAIANGINLPNSTTGAISVNPQMTGAASGLSGFLQISTGALATFIVGQLQDDSQWPMVWSMFISALLALAAYLLIKMSKKRRA